MGPEVYTMIGDIGDGHEPDESALSAQERRYDLPLDGSSHLLFDPRLYMGLSNLFIRNCRYSGSLNDFINLVVYRTSIESLSLTDFLGNFASDFTEQPWRPGFDLTRLDKLTLSEGSATYPCIAAFLDRVQLSPTIHLSIVVQVSEGSELTGGVAALLPRKPTDSLPILRFASDANLEIGAGDRSYNFKLERAGPAGFSKGYLHFGIIFDSREQWAASGTLSSIADLLRDFQVPLTFLAVESEYAGSLADDHGWEALFRSLPRLEQMIIRGHGIDDALFSGLTLASKSFACRELRNLECDHVVGSSDLFLAILNCMSMRYHVGLPLFPELMLNIHYDRTNVPVRQRIADHYIPSIEAFVLDLQYNDHFNEDWH